jgi:DNA-binding PadR family transcriptional regulator
MANIFSLNLSQYLENNTIGRPIYSVCNCAMWKRYFSQSTEPRARRAATTTPMPSSRRIPKGLTEALILRSLSKGPRHGYALVKELEEMGADPAARARIYPILARMEKSGLVGRAGEDETGGRARLLYTLTERGREELAAQRQAPAALREALAELWGENPTGGWDAPPGMERSAGRGAPASGPRSGLRTAAQGGRAAETAPGAAPIPARSADWTPLCSDARIQWERDAGANAITVRLVNCPMGAFEYCARCPFFVAAAPLRRVAAGL